MFGGRLRGRGFAGKVAWVKQQPAAAAVSLPAARDGGPTHQLGAVALHAQHADPGGPGLQQREHVIGQKLADSVGCLAQRLGQRHEGSHFCSGAGGAGRPLRWCRDDRWALRDG